VAGEENSLAVLCPFELFARPRNTPAALVRLDTVDLDPPQSRLRGASVQPVPEKGIPGAPTIVYSFIAAGTFYESAGAADCFGASASTTPRPAYRAAIPRSAPSRNRPLRWSQRYEIVLRLHLAGWRTREIAAELRYCRTAFR
jgi:hypothetical protein